MQRTSYNVYSCFQVLVQNGDLLIIWILAGKSSNCKWITISNRRKVYHCSTSLFSLNDRNRYILLIFLHIIYHTPTDLLRNGKIVCYYYQFLLPCSAYLFIYMCISRVMIIEIQYVSMTWWTVITHDTFFLEG